MRRNEEDAVRAVMKWKSMGKDLKGGLERGGWIKWKKILRKWSIRVEDISS